MIFTNTLSLGPAEHLVVFADNNVEQGPLHAPFRINRAGDELVLTGTATNGGRFPIDRVEFGRQIPNVAWSRLGSSGPWRATSPTPRAENVPAGWDGLARADGSFTFGFATDLGFNYVVEYADDPAASTWTALPAVRGTGLEQTVIQPLFRIGSSAPGDWRRKRLRRLCLFELRLRTNVSTFEMPN